MSIPLPSPTRQVLFETILAHLHRHDVPYCVVGDTRGYPHTIASDVDIVVPDEQLEWVLAGLSSLEQQGIRLYQCIQHEFRAFYLAFGPAELAQLPPTFIHIDICSHYYRYGKLLLEDKYLLNQRYFDEAKGFFVPLPAVDFIYYLMKRIDKLALTRTHGELLSHWFAQQPQKATTYIYQFFHQPDTCADLVRSAETGEWTHLYDFLPLYRRHLRQTLAQLNRGRFGDRFKEWFRRLKRITCPTGVFIELTDVLDVQHPEVIHLLRDSLLPLMRQEYVAGVQQPLGPLALRKALASSTLVIQDGRPHRAWMTPSADFCLSWVHDEHGSAWRLASNRPKSAARLFPESSGHVGEGFRQCVATILEAMHDRTRLYYPVFNAVEPENRQGAL
ncbi:MAG: hypothetical protein KC476_02645 [Cyanobacteria bacterium HKST-UBA06]|nr:hypothetical protein [Cyanobacteria bacterium HKST-UBA06]